MSLIVRLGDVNSEDCLLSVPDTVLETLGWAVGDDLELDVPVTGGGLVIHLARQPGASTGKTLTGSGGRPQEQS